MKKKAHRKAKREMAGPPPATITESGELERPVVRRQIDCGGKPEIADRHVARGASAPRFFDHLSAH